MEAISNARLEDYPFGYIYMQPFFEPSFYNDLLETMPSSHKPLGARDTREDGTSTRDVVDLMFEPDKLPLPWHAAVLALGHPQVKISLFDKFKHVIAARFGLTPEQAVLLPALHMDIRLMRDTQDYRLAPHTDAASKILTLQAYLPKDNSTPDLGTSFYKLTKLEIVSRDFGEVKRMPFLVNSAYAFAIKRDEPGASWHGREKLTDANVQRDTIILNYYGELKK
jgi:hypothetical protein